MLNQVDKLEVITLVDNYIDLTADDSSPSLKRAIPLENMVLKKSFLAEHGFCAVIRTTRGSEVHSFIFDFGFSTDTAVKNADALGLDLRTMEMAVLSHGHNDHFGGIAEVGKKIGKSGLPFVVHPSAFRKARYWYIDEKQKISLPGTDRKSIEKAGFAIVESKKPYPLIGGDALFLGEIPRKTSFEKINPCNYFITDDKAVLDPIEDDTGVAINVAGKGLVVISGCAHAGIINTVEHAMTVTGVKQLYGVMGGFHLSEPGFDFNAVIEQTVQAIKVQAPNYVIPTHCTGRKAILKFEHEMPEQFIVNMVGTTLIF